MHNYMIIVKSTILHRISMGYAFYFNVVNNAQSCPNLRKGKFIYKEEQPPPP